MDDNNLAEETTRADPMGCSQAVTSRPTTLNILLDNCLKSPLLPSSLTPLEGLQPLLRSEMEKILQQLTPSGFSTPGHLPEDQERLANLFSQKLSELQDSSDFATLTAALSPAVTSSGLYNVTFPDLGSQHISSIAELCRQANQARLATSPASILLYSPTNFDPQSLAAAQTVNSSGSITYQHNLDGSNMASDPVNALNQLQGSLSLSLPNGSLTPDREVTTVQLPNGLRFGISTSLANSQPNVFQMLGLESPADLVPNVPVSQSDTSRWSQAQANPPSETSLNDTFQSSDSITRDLGEARPGSVDNDGSRPTRSPSVSSVSSSSQANSFSRKAVTSPNLQDTRLDPNEQSRMRLERKRARNRDAARKCRERKIRLIKNLEKDVFHLSEENKALRNRLSVSRSEVERLKMFVANHLEKDCPALSGKVA